MTLFANTIDDFIFRNPMSAEEFEEREEEFDERFGVVDEPGDGHAHSTSFRSSSSSGPTADCLASRRMPTSMLTDNLVGELTYDLVQGSLTRAAIRCRGFRRSVCSPASATRSNALQVGGSVTAVGQQGRVFGAETPTGGTVY